MAFKIESIQELRKIADTLTQYSEEVNSEVNKVVGAIEQLDALVSGQGVDEALTKLKDAVNGLAPNAVQTLKYTSLFIKTQTASYAQTKSTTENSLNTVQSALDGIVL